MKKISAILAIMLILTTLPVFSEEIYETSAEVPTDFIAETAGLNINLSWNKTATYSYIRYSTTAYPTDRTEGVFLYNETANNITAEFSENTTYYFSIWGYNSTGFSTTYGTATNTTEQSIIPENIIFPDAHSGDYQLVPDLEMNTTTNLHTICLESDEYGWSDDPMNSGTSGYVDVYVNGTMVLSDVTLSGGLGPVCHSFPANEGENITTDYTAGSAPSGNYYSINAPNGSQIAEDGAGSTVPTGISCNASESSMKSFSHVDCLDDWRDYNTMNPKNDTTETMIYNLSSSSSDIYSFEDVELEGTLHNITIHAICKSVGEPQTMDITPWVTVSFDGFTHSPFIIGNSSFKDYAVTLDQWYPDSRGPPESITWDVVNDLDVEISHSSSSTGILQCTMLYVEINYSPLPEEPEWENIHKMHYPQLPDPNGWDVSFADYDVTPVEPESRYVGDDWNCSFTGNVTDIHFWFSWLDDMNTTIGDINISIWSDNPSGPDGHSIPETMLWQKTVTDSEYEIIGPHPGLQGWYWSEGEIIPDMQLEYYRLDIWDITEPFYQEEGTIYWLIIDMPEYEGGATYIGWKTSVDHWNDAAVYGDGFNWTNITDPVESPMPMDLSFVIGGMEEVTYQVNKTYNSSTPDWQVTRWDTIQDAVMNCSNSNKKYVIEVDNGTYYENLIIDIPSDFHSLQLIGYDKPKIISNFSTAIKNYKNNLFVSNFNITSKNYAIQSYADNVRVTDCRISAEGTAISGVDEIAYCSIFGEDQGAGTLDAGILVKSNSNIHHNEIYHEDIGIRLHGVEDTIIYKNNISASHVIHLQYTTENNTIYNNNFYGSIAFQSFSGTNKWNSSYPEGGNHWEQGPQSHATQDMYCGPNQNISLFSDLICDNTSGGFDAFIIDSNNTDFYPYLSEVKDQSEIIYPPQIEVKTNNKTAITVQIDQGENSTHSYVMYSNSSYPTTRNEGILAYNGTNDYFTINSLDENTTYYFTAWGYNQYINTYSDLNNKGQNTTYSRFFPSELIATNPSNNSQYVVPSKFTFNITVIDKDNESVTISIYWMNNTLINTSTIGTPFSEHCYMETQIMQLEHETTYNWYVTINDGMSTLNESFTFETSRNYDLNGDGTVNYLDISIVVSSYLQSVNPPGSEAADINDDGIVNYLDVSMLVSNYLTSY